MISSTIDNLMAVLCGSRNADGAWGYYRERASRIESTCWAALYLSRAQKSKRYLADGAARWLASRQRADGFVDDTTRGSPNLGFNGLVALCVPGAEPWPVEPAKRLLAALGRTAGVALANAATVRQDNTLRGWSWIEGTFSGIEPTSWCLLALKKSPTVLHPRERSARIEEAERLLLDRVCATRRLELWQFQRPRAGAAPPGADHRPGSARAAGSP